MNKITSEMTVLEIVNSISCGEIKVKDVAEFYNKSERTIQNRIKKTGYSWSAKEKKYVSYDEKLSLEYNNKLFSELINPNVINKIQKENEGRKNSNNISIGTVSKRNHDSIDTILFGDSISNNRVQRAYYLDKDIAGIIDKIDGKQKSNLVNQCLRKVFEEKGLL